MKSDVGEELYFASNFSGKKKSFYIRYKDDSQYFCTLRSRAKKRIPRSQWIPWDSIGFLELPGSAFSPLLSDGHFRNSWSTMKHFLGLILEVTIALLKKSFLNKTPEFDSGRVTKNLTRVRQHYI